MLEGKIALITGAGKGIGRALAIRFAKEGADLSLLAKTESDLKLVAEEVEKLGRKAVYFPTDVTDSQSVKEAVKKTLETYGRIDCLVNNAGMMKIAPFENISNEDDRKVMELNYFSVKNLTREVLSQSKPEIIVFMNSQAAVRKLAGNTSYGASKTAIKAFADSLRLEKPELKVLSIYPAGVNTPGIKGDHIDKNTWDPTKTQNLEAEHVADATVDLMKNYHSTGTDALLDLENGNLKITHITD